MDLSHKSIESTSCGTPTRRLNLTADEELNMKKTEFRITAAAAQGGRRYMEDRIHLVVNRDKNGKINHIFAGVYDGHGGPQASQYVCSNLYNNIITTKGFDSDDDNVVVAAIRNAFLRTHANMKKVQDQWPPTSGGYPCTAGTTASCLFIRDGRIYTGHVGDSAIILVNFVDQEAGYDDAKITLDHRPDDAREKSRIEQSGGAVMERMGLTRVVWNRPIDGHQGPIRRSTYTEQIPFLAVARSLGDFWSYNQSTDIYVVSPEPDVDAIRLKSTDRFILLVSDGVTSVMDTNSVVRSMKNFDSRKNSPDSKKSKNGSMNHAHYLLNTVFANWGQHRADNISIICIEINYPANPERMRLNNHDVDVNLALTEHPTSMIRINQTMTERLQSNAPLPVYAGPLELPKLMNAPNVSTHQSSKGVKEESGFFFEGPGFVVPSQFADSGSDSDIDEQHLPPLPINTLQSYLPTFYNKENPRSSWNSLPFSVNRFFSIDNKENSSVPSLNSNLLSRYTPTPTPITTTSLRNVKSDADKRPIIKGKGKFHSFSGGIMEGPLLTRLKKGIKRRMFEEQEEEEDGQDSTNKRPSKKRKLEKDQKRNLNQSVADDGDDMIVSSTSASPNILKQETHKMKKVDDDNASGSGRRLWNFLTGLLKPFSPFSSPMSKASTQTRT